MLKKLRNSLIIIALINMILANHSIAFAANKAADLNKKQLTNLMQILSEAYYLNNYNNKTSDYFTVVKCLLNSGNILNNKAEYGIHGCKIKTSTVNAYMKKYYNIEKKQSFVNKNSEEFQVKGGYYYFVSGAGDPHPIIRIISAKKSGKKYSVTYDIYMEEDTEYSYCETRSAIVGKVPKSNEISVYSITCKGKKGNCSQITYLPINPEFVDSNNKYVILEGILVRGTGSYTNGKQYEATILKLPEAIKTTDIEGKKISIKEIHIVPYIPLFNESLYGKKVFVYGETMAGHSQYHARKLLLMNAILSSINCKG